MTQVRLGTVGTGSIVHWVLDNVAKTEGIEVAAVYSRSPEKGTALAEKYGADRVYTELEGLLGDGNVNCVYIASPNSLHYEQAKQALLAGKHVILEKPFTPCVAQARELAALAKEKGLYLIDAVPPAFMPNLEILRRELPKIGPVKLVMSNYSQYSSRYDRFLAGEMPNIFNPVFAGGSLMDINFYNVYLDVALFGKPGNVTYFPNLCRDIDTSGVLVMEHEGFVSQATGAKDTWGVNFLQIEGERGYIYVPDGSGALTQVRVVTAAGEETFNEQPNPDRWFYEVGEITRILREQDWAEAQRRLDVTLDVIDTLEQARKKAGIWFPGD